MKHLEGVANGRMVACLRLDVQSVAQKTKTSKQKININVIHTYEQKGEMNKRDLLHTTHVSECVLNGMCIKIN